MPCPQVKLVRRRGSLTSSPLPIEGLLHATHGSLAWCFWGRLLLRSVSLRVSGQSPRRLGTFLWFRRKNTSQGGSKLGLIRPLSPGRCVPAGTLAPPLWASASPFGALESSPAFDCAPRVWSSLQTPRLSARCHVELSRKLYPWWTFRNLRLGPQNNLHK